jgi:ornithine cyclodeaminase
MHGDQLYVLTGPEVRTILHGREPEIMRAVTCAYQAHGKGQTALPHSTFLRFPGDELNRIIALPAFLGDGNGGGVAGMKWISSFPGNLTLGIERASAVLILNSVTTGRPEALMEASSISAKRTAASAAIAAQALSRSRPPSTLGVIGCGLIGFEIARFARHACPSLTRLICFDIDCGRAAFFAEKCPAVGYERAEAAEGLGQILRECPLIAFATTAIRPHVESLADCVPGTVILHISLRDLSPQAILATRNIVDDVDHVCRSQTSVHLAEQAVGHRNFIAGTLAELLDGTIAAQDAARTQVFSPFGLGICDLAVAALAMRLAAERDAGTRIPAFHPESWDAANA